MQTYVDRLHQITMHLKRVNIYQKNKLGMCTQKTESVGMINTNTLKQEIEHEWELSKLDDTSRDINPYRELKVNNAGKVKTVLSQMEPWSILSNVTYSVQHDKHPKNFHNLNISAVNKVNSKRNSNIKEEHRHELDLDFEDMPEKLRGEYLDVYEGIQSEILSTTRLDENSDISTINLGRVDMIKYSRIKAEESFTISEQGYMMGKLLGRKECQVLLDTGASKSFMSKSHYLHCGSLHPLPMFASRTQRIQAGNGQFVTVLFIIAIIIDIHGHRFEIYSLVSEIHEKCRLSSRNQKYLCVGRCNKFTRLLFQFLE